MSQNLKDLLEKIKQEGIKLGEENRKAIESKAKQDAEKIIENAKKEAEKIIAAAKGNAEKTKLNGEATLKQASRDLFLSLKEEIKKLLNKIVSSEINKTMSQEEVQDILSNLIEKYISKNGDLSDIKVVLKKDDLDKIKQHFIARLKEKIKDGIEFKPSTNINAGFYISFDKGKSYFDFTDEGLTETLCVFLNPELSKLIK